VSFDKFIIFTFFCILLIFVIFIVSFSVSERTNEYEKLTTYECGFVTFADSRGIFEVSFYVVAISSSIFDVEIVLLIPIILFGKIFNIWVFFISFVLLFLLFLGFVLEWKKIAVFQVK
jgi:NADH-quinone oxidoreductase subunit A